MATTTTLLEYSSLERTSYVQDDRWTPLVEGPLIVLVITQEMENALPPPWFLLICRQ